nr:hypothetical protein Itr_chr03CG09350 [Ipomoea trifida]
MPQPADDQLRLASRLPSSHHRHPKKKKKTTPADVLTEKWRMTGDWSTASSPEGRVAGSLAAQQSHRPPSSPLAVSSAASPSASGVALKKDRSSDDATTGNLASPSSAAVPSGCIASAPHVQRPTANAATTYFHHL